MSIYELYTKRITQIASDSFEIEGIVEDFEGTVDQVYLDGVLWTDAVVSLDNRKHTLTITSSRCLTGDETITFTVENRDFHEDYAGVQ